MKHQAAYEQAGEVVIGGKTVLGLADARKLHAGLKVGKDYTNWIKERIAKFGFRSGADYEIGSDLSSPNPASSKSRPQKRSVYRITLRMAKHLAMVENNDAGRTVRDYFVWIEEAAWGFDNQSVQGDFWASQGAPQSVPAPGGSRLSAADRSVIGGITKRVSGAAINQAIVQQVQPVVAAIADDVRDLRSEIEALRALVVAAASAGSAAAAPARLTFRPMKAVLFERGLGAYACARLSSSCSAALRKYCIRAGRPEGVHYVPDLDRRYLFRTDVVQDWWQAEGARKVANDLEYIFLSEGVPPSDLMRA